MSRRRIYVETRSKRSFDIALLTTMYLIIAVFIEIFWAPPLDIPWWKTLLWMFIAPASIGYGLAIIAKLIEKIEEKW